MPKRIVFLTCLLLASCASAQIVIVHPPPWVFEGGAAVDTNLQAWYEYAVSNEVTAGSYPDDGLYGNDATQANVNLRPAYTNDGGTISAVVFDGIDDVIYILRPGGQFITGVNVTIAAWIKHGGSVGAQTIYVQSDEDVAGYATHSFYLDAANKMNYDNYRPGGGLLTSTTAVGAGAWHHVAFTRIANAVLFYLDGIVDGGGVGEAMQDSAAIDSTTTGARVYQGGFINPFKGIQDEFRVYDRGLASNEVYELSQENTH